VICGGYKKDFKWRPFEETNVKFNIDRQKQASQVTPRPQPTLSQHKDSLEPSSTPSPHDHSRLLDNEDAEARLAKDEERSTNPERDATQLEPLVLKHASSILEETDSNNAITLISNPPSELSPLPVPVNEQAEFPPTINHVTMDSTTSFSSFASRSVSPSFAAVASPTLTQTELLGQDELPQDIADSEFVNFSMPEDMQFSFVTTSLDNVDIIENDIFSHQIAGSMDFASEDTMLTLPPQFSTLSTNMLDNGPQRKAPPWYCDFSPLYSNPGYGIDTPEALIATFASSTCGILSMVDGDGENPWRTLIWPMAQQSPALMHAILAMTAFHSSAQHPALRIVGHEHKSTSLRHIRDGISQNSMTDQTAIATALALGFAESWDQHTASGNTHIKGAQALVKRTLKNHSINPLTGIELSQLKFLCNAWVYMDVIARLTAFDSVESCDFDNTFLFSADAPQTVLGVEQSGFGIDFGIPIDARLDPLMGCAGTLFPLIGRVANVVRKVCRSLHTAPGIISKAGDLKDKLERWMPPAYIESPQDISTNVQHALQTAEAYRWATLLHLHQSVPEIPSMSSTELAQRVLQYLATVPLTSRTVVVQIFPLMVAGCEAQTAEDRDWVRQRWDAMSKRMRIGVIEKSARVTEEVWMRRDMYEAQPTTNRRLVATADLQPGGRKSSFGSGHPSTADFDDADPGRTGMVYSWDYAATINSEEPVPPPQRPERKVPDRIIGPMDVAYTVRGHLHWVGIMWDWGWEVLLG